MELLMSEAHNNEAVLTRKPRQRTPPRRKRSGGSSSDDAGSGFISHSGSRPNSTWDPKEDKMVIKLVALHGAKKWTVIAQHLPNRSVSSSSPPASATGLKCVSVWSHEVIRNFGCHACGRGRFICRKVVGAPRRGHQGRFVCGACAE